MYIYIKACQLQTHAILCPASKGVRGVLCVKFCIFLDPRIFEFSRPFQISTYLGVGEVTELSSGGLIFARGGENFEVAPPLSEVQNFRRPPPAGGEKF